MRVEIISTDRGFAAVKGKTVKSVDTTAINSVVIKFTDGTNFRIDGENWYQGIPELTCTEQLRDKG